MIRLQFRGVREVDGTELGPSSGFRIAGNFVRELPSENVVARFERYHWTVNGKFYMAYDCLEPAIVYFEEALGGTSPAFGPFDDIHTADGVMYCNKEFFAKFVEESLLWLSVRTETHWPMLVIASPETVPENVPGHGR